MIQYNLCVSRLWFDVFICVRLFVFVLRNQCWTPRGEVLVLEDNFEVLDLCLVIQVLGKTRGHTLHQSLHVFAQTTSRAKTYNSVRYRLLSKCAKYSALHQNI